MVLFFRIITRLFVVGFAYIMACIAAMATLTIGVFGWRMQAGVADFASPEEEIITYFLQTIFGIFSFGEIISAALVPAAFAILLLEAFSVRSFTYNALSGGVLALILLTSADVYQGEIAPQSDTIIALAAGFVGGAMYWLIAGRNAGAWRVVPQNGLSRISQK